MSSRIALFAFLASVFLAGPLAAQNNPNQPAKAPNPQANAPQPFEGSPLYWQVDLIMQQVAKGITQHYKLSDKQEEYTRKLLTQRVKQFLKDHERETRTLLTEYMAYQSSGELPPAEAAKEFARRVRPMIAAMHKEIVDGNMQWREILNDEQRKMHDRDLDNIDKAFQQHDAQFERWSKGDVEPADFPSTVSQQPRRIMKNEDAWQYYVSRFIQDYRLDQGQQETALSALRVLREEAARYRDAHKDEFTQLDTKYQEIFASDPKTKPEELEQARAKRKDLDKRREQLDKPISIEMFERLKQQLQAIPRADQRQAYEQREARLKQAEARARQAYAARAATRPVSMTQPADSETKPASAPAR